MKIVKTHEDRHAEGAVDRPFGMTRKTPLHLHIQGRRSTGYTSSLQINSSIVSSMYELDIGILVGTLLVDGRSVAACTSTIIIQGQVAVASRGFLINRGCTSHIILHDQHLILTGLVGIEGTARHANTIRGSVGINPQMHCTGTRFVTTLANVNCGCGRCTDFTGDQVICRCFRVTNVSIKAARGNSGTLSNIHGQVTCCSICQRQDFTASRRRSIVTDLVQLPGSAGSTAADLLYLDVHCPG